MNAKKLTNMGLTPENTQYLVHMAAREYASLIAQRDKIKSGPEIVEIDRKMLKALAIENAAIQALKDFDWAQKVEGAKLRQRVEAARLRQKMAEEYEQE